jgi:hypothetical protein
MASVQTPQIYNEARLGVLHVHGIRMGVLNKLNEPLGSRDKRRTGAGR